jgi:hypothetical protein
MSITADKAVEMVEALEGALEGRIRSASWNLETLQIPLQTATDAGLPDRSNVGTEGDVIFEPSTGRYRADMRAVLAWHGGTDPFWAAWYTQSFDGEMEWEFTCGEPGLEPPPRERFSHYPRTGQIAKRIHELPLVESWGWSSGIGYFSPYFMGRRFSAYLKERLEKAKFLSVTDTDAGVWRIHVIDEVGPGRHEFDLHIDYDLDKGGLVTRAVWGDEKTEKAWKQISVDLQDVQEQWVPRQAEWVFLLPEPHGLSRLNYHNVRLNQPLDPSVFQLTFPEGTEVIDRRLAERESGHDK